MAADRERYDPKWDRYRDKVADALEARRKASTVSDEARIAQLEDDVGRLTLLFVTTLEVLISKGVATRDDMRVIAAELDALDGADDGKLDPAALRPPKE